jgi:hypothetical protein
MISQNDSQFSLSNSGILPVLSATLSEQPDCYRLKLRRSFGCSKWMDHFLQDKTLMRFFGRLLDFKSLRELR